MRPQVIYSEPPLHPFVCIRGCTPRSRKHFVDLGIDTEMKNIHESGQLYYTEGTLYLCDECMISLIRDYLGGLFKFQDQQSNARKNDYSNAAEEIKTLQQEIFGLHKIINLKDKDIKRLSAGEAPVLPQGSAQEIISTLLGVDNGPGSTDSIVVDDNPVTAGDDSESDVDDSESESSSVSEVQLDTERSIFA